MIGNCQTELKFDHKQKIEECIRLIETDVFLNRLKLISRFLKVSFNRAIYVCAIKISEFYK